jgi:hypothetical protein
MSKLLSLLLPLPLLAACASLQPPAPAPVPVEAVPIHLDAAAPARAILGRLRYLGGLQLDSSDKRFGGISSLKWRRGLLYGVTDTGDWISIRTVERGGRLEGASVTGLGDLLGPDGGKLEGSATGDAESLTRDGNGWLVAFEHDHKILRYRQLGGVAVSSGLEPRAIFGPLEKNNGVETLASRRGRLFLCAERLPTPAAPNCFIRDRKGSQAVDLSPPAGLDPATGFPVDADWDDDGTLYILMRSWSGGMDHRAAILSRAPDGKLRTIATFVAPVIRDNYEGLAVRQEAGRTFLYLVSDDNFGEYDDPSKPGTWQRTLLMKFELVG